MKDSKGSFNILSCIEKHIQALKPLLPKQAIICIGEYPIKALLKEADVYRDGVLPIFMEKSSDDIYKWVPDGYNPHLVIGFEDANVDTHFWYNVLPAMAKDHSITDSLKKKSAEKLRGAIFFASVSDGVGSAAIPSLTAKFKAQSIDSLSIAVLPSKIQPADAHFNAYSALQMCLATEGSTVLLLSRDQLENYEGVDRKGIPLRGNAVVNYLLSVFLDKELLVPEIAELSRTFNVKLFSALAVTGASYKIYGSLGNMLNAVLLKPLSTFDLSSASLLYVLLRMPLHLKNKIPRAQIELEITNWFKEKTALQSIHISEPIYSDDSSDRIDAVLFIGGFDQTQMFQEFEGKVQKLKRRAIKEGYLTEDWRINMDLNLERVETVEVPMPQATAEQVTEKAEAPQPEEKISDVQPLSHEEEAIRPEAEPETTDLTSPETVVAAEKTEIKES